MKRQVQELGIRKWFGDDLTDLQDELYVAVEGIVADYGNCVLSGASVSQAGGLYFLSAGVCFLKDSNGANGKLCRIYAQSDIGVASFPLYLVQATKDKTQVPAYGRAYEDGVTKNVTVEYYAAVQSTQPAHSNYITIAADSSTTRLKDAIQDAFHRMVTDTQVNTWNNKAGSSVATQQANGLMAAADKTKLDGLNNYTHPANHAPSIISQDSNNRFVTDTEKAAWNGKLNASDSVSTNTANKTVKRDASGNFAANTITVTDIIIA